MSKVTSWTVGFPRYNGCTLLDFAGATQIFSSWVSAGFESVWLAPSLEPVTTSEGVQVQPGRRFDDRRPIDILFVPGGGEDVATVMQDPVYIEFVRHAGQAARFAGSVCTGAFIAAAAGLLDGCEATTYWSQRENLALFPRIKLAAGYPRWVFSGNRFTGGGVSSSIDLALELVDRLAGPTECQQAQLSAQYAPKPPFDSGDPATAPPEVTAAVRANQKQFLAVIKKATLAVIGGA
ncbi:MAG: DJ-1/PfpI family protein [Acidobacteria bacterium]|nr:DJ-1/PfpI family protein [Acidobacteriota bacterium]